MVTKKQVSGHDIIGGSCVVVSMGCCGRQRFTFITRASHGGSFQANRRQYACYEGRYVEMKFVMGYK